MRYDEGPTAHAEVVIDAPVEVVWALVTDINLPAQFSKEFRGATWIDEGPAMGALRWSQLAQGHGRVGDGLHRQPLRSAAEFGWCVTDADEPRRPGALNSSRPRCPPPSTSPHGPGAIRTEHRDHRHAREGGTHRGSPARGIRSEHARPRSTASRPSRAAVVTCASASSLHRTASTDRVHPAGGATRRRLDLGARVLGRRRPHPARVPRGADVEHSVGHRHRAARRPDAGDAGDVGTVDAGPLRRTFRARHRNERTASHGGMARRPLRQARATHTRDHRHHPRSPPASVWSTTARSTSCRCPTAKDAASVRSCRQRTYRSMSRRSARTTFGSQASWPTGGSATSSRDSRRLLRPDSRRRRPCRTLVRRSRPHRRGRARVYRRRRSRWAPPCRGLRVHLRGDGPASTNFYNNALERQGYGDDVRGATPLLGGRQGGRSRANADRDRSRHEPHRYRRSRTRTPTALSRRRGQDTARGLQADLQKNTDAALRDLARLLELVADINR